MSGRQSGVMGTAARTAAILVIAILATGCATTKPIWFIATPGYVEAQIATSEDATRQDYQSRINQLESELASQRAVSMELAELVEVISEIESSNRELVQLADELEIRLADIPDETVRHLVEILQAHLENPGDR